MIGFVSLYILVHMLMILWSVLKYVALVYVKCKKKIVKKSGKSKEQPQLEILPYQQDKEQSNVHKI